jgi:predicted transcriptional regulator
VKYSYNIIVEPENILLRITFGIRFVKMLPPLAEIGRRRKLLMLSQKQLATLSGVSQSMIAKIERSRINPSYLKTKAIFDTLEGLERKNELKAKDLSHPKIVRIQARDTVAKGVRVMRETGFSQLPVFEGEKPVGSLTEKVILQNLVSAKDPEEISKQPVERIMDEAFPTVTEDTPLSMISTLLGYQSAVLLAKKGHVVGIITKADLVKVIGSTAESGLEK